MIGHCSGAGVGQHINGQHAGRECELVVMSSLKSALTLLNGYFRKITDCVSEMMRCGYVQRILLAHNKLPPVVCFGGTPVVKAGFPVPALLSGQHLSFFAVFFFCCFLFFLVCLTAGERLPQSRRERPWEVLQPPQRSVPGSCLHRRRWRKPRSSRRNCSCRSGRR